MASCPLHLSRIGRCPFKGGMAVSVDLPASYWPLCSNQWKRGALQWSRKLLRWLMAGNYQQSGLHTDYGIHSYLDIAYHREYTGRHLWWGGFPWILATKDQPGQLEFWDCSGLEGLVRCPARERHGRLIDHLCEEKGQRWCCSVSYDRHGHERHGLGRQLHHRRLLYIRRFRWPKLLPPVLSHHRLPRLHQCCGMLVGWSACHASRFGNRKYRCSKQMANVGVKYHYVLWCWRHSTWRLSRTRPTIFYALRNGGGCIHYLWSVRLPCTKGLRLPELCEWLTQLSHMVFGHRCLRIQLWQHEQSVRRNHPNARKLHRCLPSWQFRGEPRRRSFPLH